MQVTIIRTLDFTVYSMIILLLMKLVVDPREFFFNSALRPVHLITDPVLQFVRKYVSIARYGTDYTPLVAIFLLIPLHMLVYCLVLPVGILPAIVSSILKTVYFLIRFFTFSLFVLAMVPSYSRNPITGFFRKVVRPLEKPFNRIFPSERKKTRIVAVFIMMCLAGIVFSTLFSGLQAKSFAGHISSWKIWALAVVRIGVVALSVYRFIIVLLMVAVILTWMALEVRNPYINLIFLLTEPILLPIRRIIPPLGGLDLSPWVAIISIWIVGSVFTRVIEHLQLYFV